MSYKMSYLNDITVIIIDIKGSPVTILVTLTLSYSVVQAWFVLKTILKSSHPKYDLKQSITTNIV